MESLELMPGADAPATLRTPRPTRTPPAEIFGTQAIAHCNADGLSWTCRNGFDAALRSVPAAAWRDPATQGWQLIKHNATRDVWRARIAGTSYYVKYYLTRGWAGRLKRWLRGPACQAEWLGGLYSIQHGIAAVRPAGYCEHIAYKKGAACLLVTEAIEPAYPLDEFWDSIGSDADAVRRRQDAAALIERLAEMIARAHQSGFEHLDMHAANILVQPLGGRRYRTLLVDLQSARLGVPIRDAAVVRNLAQLNQWFRRHATIGDRLRFLRAYFRWRNEFESSFDLGRRLGLGFDEVVRALARSAESQAERIGRQRDRRVLRDGRYFGRVKLAGGGRGVVFLQCKRPTPDSPASARAFERSWWRTQLGDPLQLFSPERQQACKTSHSAIVTRAVLPHAEGALPVIVKRPQPRNGWRALRMLLPPSRSRRGWQLGHALLHRDIPAARPLALLERRVGPFVRDSVLMTEFIPGAVDLEVCLAQAQARLSGQAWLRFKRELTELAARELRRLAERGFLHRDCKAQNLLVTPPPQLRLVWIDMDGIRYVGAAAALADLRPVTRLHVSLLDMPGLTRGDRVRFLKAYLARFGSDPRAWREIWRAVSLASESKLKARQARRAWKLEHYGRE